VRRPYAPLQQPPVLLEAGVRDDDPDAVEAVPAALDALATEAADDAAALAAEGAAYAADDSDPDTGSEPAAAGAFAAPASAASAATASATKPRTAATGGDAPCSCFCPRTAAGVLPLPPIVGHAMVVVDGGTTPVMIGGRCIEAAAGAGGGSSGDEDVVYTSKVWYMRVGRGNDYRYADAIAARVRAAQGAAAPPPSPLSPDEAAEAADGHRRQARQRGPWNPPPVTTTAMERGPLALAEIAAAASDALLVRGGTHGKRSRRRAPALAAGPALLEQPGDAAAVAGGQVDGADGVTPGLVRHAAAEGGAAADGGDDGSNIDVMAITLPGVGMALRDMVRSQYGSLHNLSKTGHTWYEVGVPPAGVAMAAIFGTRRADSLTGGPMPPRSGHTAAAFARAVGDGGDRARFVRLLRGPPTDARTLTESIEVLWPRAFVGGAAVPEPVPVGRGAGAWGALRYDWVAGRDVWAETAADVLKAAAGTAPRASPLPPGQLPPAPLTLDTATAWRRHPLDDEAPDGALPPVRLSDNDVPRGGRGGGRPPGRGGPRH